MSTNAGFRPQELTQRRFREAVAKTIDNHVAVLNALKAGLEQTDGAAKLTREFMIETAERLEAFQARTFRDRRSHRNLRDLSALFRRHYPIRGLYPLGVGLNLLRYSVLYAAGRLSRSLR